VIGGGAANGLLSAESSESSAIFSYNMIKHILYFILLICGAKTFTLNNGLNTRTCVNYSFNLFTNSTQTNTNTNIMGTCTTQNDLLMGNLMKFYDEGNNLEKMLKIINGESPISLRIIDWFATNYAKKFFTVYEVGTNRRFKVYVDYKLKLKAYSKRRFDPFCRWDRITIPYSNGTFIQTTIGQLNFFKWALENGVIAYIEAHYATIEDDMNARNSTSRRNNVSADADADMNAEDSTGTCAKNNGNIGNINNKTRKKREELSISATKSIKKETVEIVVSFN
jgi:hypothetical protein